MVEAAEFPFFSIFSAFIFLLVCASIFMYGIANHIYWKIQTKAKKLARVFFCLDLLIVWLARRTLSPIDVMSYNALQQIFPKKKTNKKFLCTFKPVDTKTLASYQTCTNM